MSFGGKRVLALESRRAAETAELIRRNGGEPFVAPSMREVPIEDNREAFRFAAMLQAGEFDMVIFLTGVGVRYLAKVIATQHDPEQFAANLRKVVTVARGPKPMAALRELGVAATIPVPEPNTYHEILAAIDGRSEKRIAVQEYGKPSVELEEALRAQGAAVTSVPVYQWELPEDLTPLREAVTRLAAEAFEVVLFTTSTQLIHLLQIARVMDLEEPVKQGIRKSVIASIGPTTTQTLVEHGFPPDVEPTHPKLGLLVKEAAEQCSELLWKKAP